MSSLKFLILFIILFVETFSIMGIASNQQGESSDLKRGLALSAVFLSRNRFAVLDKNRQVLLISPSPSFDQICHR